MSLSEMKEQKLSSQTVHFHMGILVIQVLFLYLYVLGKKHLQSSFDRLVLIAAILYIQYPVILTHPGSKDRRSDKRKTANRHHVKAFKWYYDENRIFPIEAILKHKQVACMRRKMLFTIFKYFFSFQRYSSFKICKLVK